MRRNSYVDSPIKRGIHHLLLREAKNGPQTGRILSLGGPDCSDLKLFAEKGFQVVSLEKVPQVFEKQRKEVGHLPSITLLKTTVEEYLPAIANGPAKQVPFQLAFIDLCGHYTAAREDAIRQLMKSDQLAPGAAVAMTFAEAHDQVGYIRGSKAFEECGKSWQGFIEDRSSAIRKALGPKRNWLTIRYTHRKDTMKMLFMLTHKERK